MKYGAPEYSKFSNFEPLSEMVNENADITLIILIPNSVSYGRPINDPLFSAYRAVLEIMASGDEKALYYADYPFSAVGCEVQVRFHNSMITAQ